MKRLADDNIPVIGHVGLIPSRATWTGGFKAVGKTADSAMQIFEAVKKYEAAGAFGAEIEVVPVEVAEAISKRTSLIMLSMGAGTGCDAQYLFAEDVLGTNRGHMPRHSKVYRNFAAEYDRLQAERVAAFSEFVADVNSKAYPEEQAHRQDGSCRTQAVHGRGRQRPIGLRTAAWPPPGCSGCEPPPVLEKAGAEIRAGCLAIAADRGHRAAPLGTLEGMVHCHDEADEQTELPAGMTRTANWQSVAQVFTDPAVMPARK